jgi:hypothetical protein
MWIASGLSRGLRRWSEALRRRRHPTIRIVAHADRYCVFSDDTLVQDVVASDIERITMFKEDLLAIDSVCAHVEVFSPRELPVPTIWEEHPGFYDAIGLFATLPGFDTDWRAKVIQPAFATNWMVVFDRSGSKADE